MTLVQREFHLFQAAGRDFLYLVPSAAIFTLDTPSAAVLRVLGQSRQTEADVTNALADRFDAAIIQTAIRELLEVRAIGHEQQVDAPPPKMLPMAPFPLSTIVLNVTNQCNLACTYC